MIKFQDILTRVVEILPDFVRESYMFCEHCSKTIEPAHEIMVLIT